MSILETNKAQISEQNGEKHTIHIAGHILCEKHTIHTAGHILCVASFFGLSKDPKDHTNKTMILANIFFLSKKNC